MGNPSAIPARRRRRDPIGRPWLPRYWISSNNPTLKKILIYMTSHFNCSMYNRAILFENQRCKQVQYPWHTIVVKRPFLVLAGYSWLWKDIRANSPIFAPVTANRNPLYDPRYFHDRETVPWTQTSTSCLQKTLLWERRADHRTSDHKGFWNFFFLYDGYAVHKTASQNNLPGEATG